MKKYVCKVCGWIYDEALGDPDNGIAPGTKWEDLPDDSSARSAVSEKTTLKYGRLIGDGQTTGNENSFSGRGSFYGSFS